MTSLLNLTVISMGVAHLQNSGLYAKCKRICSVEMLTTGPVVLFFLNECSSKHIPISVLHRNVLLGMLNEYIHIQDFYKDLHLLGKTEPSSCLLCIKPALYLLGNTVVLKEEDNILVMIESKLRYLRQGCQSFTLH